MSTRAAALRGLCQTAASTKWLARLGAVNDGNDVAHICPGSVLRIVRAVYGRSMSHGLCMLVMYGVRVGNDTTHTCVYGLRIVIYICWIQGSSSVLYYPLHDKATGHVTGNMYATRAIKVRSLD